LAIKKIYIISISPNVFNTRRATNHNFLSLFVANHKAKPFQIRVQIRIGI